MILIAGPCVIDEKTPEIADRIAEYAEEYSEFKWYFKASYDKANRTSLYSYRGPGLIRGLEILEYVKKEYGLRITTDVHNVEDVYDVSCVADMVQIPALLCRQTDLLQEAARYAKEVNIKKGQFMAPWDMANAVEKVRASGCNRVTVTERGTSFGYNRLVVDICSIPVMQGKGMKVIATAPIPCSSRRRVMVVLHLSRGNMRRR